MDRNGGAPTKDFPQVADVGRMADAGRSERPLADPGAGGPAGVRCHEDLASPKRRSRQRSRRRCLVLILTLIMKCTPCPPCIGKLSRRKKARHAGGDRHRTLCRPRLPPRRRSERRTSDGSSPGLFRWSQIASKQPSHLGRMHGVRPITVEARELPLAPFEQSKAHRLVTLRAYGCWLAFGHSVPQRMVPLSFRRNQRESFFGAGHAASASEAPRAGARKRPQEGMDFSSKSVEGVRGASELPMRSLAEDCASSAIGGPRASPDFLVRKTLPRPYPCAATGSLCRECHGYATARKGKS